MGTLHREVHCVGTLHREVHCGSAAQGSLLWSRSTRKSIVGRSTIGLAGLAGAKGSAIVFLVFFIFTFLKILKYFKYFIVNPWPRYHRQVQYSVL